jgi:hypothetical protein
MGHFIAKLQWLLSIFLCGLLDFNPMLVSANRKDSRVTQKTMPTSQSVTDEDGKEVADVALPLRNRLGSL